MSKVRLRMLAIATLRKRLIILELALVNFFRKDFSPPNNLSWRKYLSSKKIKRVYSIRRPSKVFHVVVQISCLASLRRFIACKKASAKTRALIHQGAVIASPSAPKNFKVERKNHSVLPASRLSRQRSSRTKSKLRRTSDSLKASGLSLATEFQISCWVAAWATFMNQSSACDQISSLTR